MWGEREAPWPCRGHTGSKAEIENREEPEEWKSERSRDTGEEIGMDKEADKGQIFTEDAIKFQGRTQSHQEHARQQRHCKGKEELSWCLEGQYSLEAHDKMRGLLADIKSAPALEKICQM